MIITTTMIMINRFFQFRFGFNPHVAGISIVSLAISSPLISRRAPPRAG